MGAPYGRGPLDFELKVTLVHYATGLGPFVTKKAILIPKTPHITACQAPVDIPSLLRNIFARHLPPLHITEKNLGICTTMKLSVDSNKGALPLLRNHHWTH